MDSESLLRGLLFCDDARREETGKEILIGLYSGGLTFQGGSPGRLRSLYTRIEFERDPDAREGNLEYKLVAPSGAHVINYVGHIKLSSSGRTIFYVVNENLVLYEAGRYSALVGLSSDPKECDMLEVSFSDR